MYLIKHSFYNKKYTRDKGVQEVYINNNQVTEDPAIIDINSTSRKKLDNENIATRESHIDKDIQNNMPTSYHNGLKNGVDKNTESFINKLEKEGESSEIIVDSYGLEEAASLLSHYRNAAISNTFDSWTKLAVQLVQTKNIDDAIHIYLKILKSLKEENKTIQYVLTLSSLASCYKTDRC